MVNVSNDAVYISIGMAVISSQSFERLFVLAARFAMKQSSAQTFEDIVPVEEAGAFKQATKSILSQISQNLDDPGLVERISSLVEDRHIVVHRLTSTYNWPGESTDEERKKIMDLCERVMSESAAVSELMFNMMTGWMNRYPQLGEPLKEALSALSVAQDK